MRDYQGGSNVGALLSYNAGPGAAQQWLGNAGGDVDVLYETVGYAETQLYLDIITVNHFMYQHLYTANAPTCGFDTAPPLIETPTPSA
jgi:soluble lytic murein transglycosylase